MAVFNSKQISFNPHNCINLKKPFPRLCRNCIINCPHGALSETKEIFRERCTECGLCMAVCPSDGFLDKDLERLGRHLFASPQIIINCPMAEPLGYEIACLGMLDQDAWTSLMLLANSKEVRIITGDCGDCEDKQACSVSVGYLKELLKAQFQLPQMKIEIRPDRNNVNPEGSKNNNKMSLRAEGKQRIKSILSFMTPEEDSNIPKTRQWLMLALQNNPSNKIPFKALKAKDDCTGCGVCSKICPQEALKMMTKDDKIRLVYEPLKCVHCLRCVDICGTESLIFENMKLSYKFMTGKILLCEKTTNNNK